MNPLWRRVKAGLRPRRERRERASARVVIVSFPKSGRTWLRLMLGKALCDARGLSEAAMLDTPALTRAAGLEPTVFSHDGTSNLEARPLERLERDKSGYRDKGVLLLARDPRDVVVSCYFQASRRRDLFRGTLSEFLRDPRYGIRKVLTWYRIWHESRGVPRAFRLLRYEDLHARPRESLRSALELIGLADPAPELLDAAVGYTRFDRMRRLEQERVFAGGVLRPKRAGDEAALKTRRGVVGGYVDFLGTEDLAWCEAAIAELGNPFGEGAG